MVRYLQSCGSATDVWFLLWIPNNMLLFYIISFLMRFVCFCNHESWDVMPKLLDFNETNETDLRILRLGRVYCVAQVAHPLQKEPPMMRNSGTSSTARGPRSSESARCFWQFLAETLVPCKRLQLGWLGYCWEWMVLGSALGCCYWWNGWSTNVACTMGIHMNNSYFLRVILWSPPWHTILT